AMHRWQRTGAPGWRVARSANALGEALYRQGRIEEAEEHLVASYRALMTDPAADRDSKRIARERVEAFYQSLGRRRALDSLLREVDGAVQASASVAAARAPD